MNKPLLLQLVKFFVSLAIPPEYEKTERKAAVSISKVAAGLPRPPENGGVKPQSRSRR